MNTFDPKNAPSGFLAVLPLPRGNTWRCGLCAFHRDEAACSAAPCLPCSRPDEEWVYFVEIEQSRTLKHTPGPWVYAPDFDSDGKRAKVTTVAQCCEFVIGLPSAYEGGNYRDGDPSGEAEADARLIAAAPDLLEALRELEESTDWVWDNRARIKARAAIAKATGKEAAHA